MLLVANLAFGAHLWLTVPAGEPDFSRREKNPQELKIVSVTPPFEAAGRAERTRKQAQSLSGSACVELSGIAPAAVPRLREIFAAMRIEERVTERKVEETTRHWVFLPPAKDRRGAEQAVSILRRQAMTDVSLRPDNAISLGVFSNEEAARRHLAVVESKGVKGAQVGPFSREMKETVFEVREPDSTLIARLALLQRDFPDAALRAVPCQAGDVAKN